MNTKFISWRYMTLVLLITLCCCKKQNEWLDVKGNKNDVVPTTLDDFEAILNNNFVNLAVNCTDISIVGSDNIFVTDDRLETLYFLSEKNAYLWKSDLYEGQSSPDYNNAYTMVAYANIVLDGLKKIKVTKENETRYNTIRGGAFFLRSITFFNIAQIFCKQYNSATAGNDLGIQLSMDSDPNITVQRSSVQQTYDQIITDLTEAVNLLPVQRSFPTQASKLAAYGALARTYLVMGKYEEARESANRVLSVSNTLIDYNNFINNTSANVFPSYSNKIATLNPEILYYARSNSFQTSGPYGLGFVDTTLLNMYHEDDLRGKLFFSQFQGNQYQIRASYTGDYSNFAGIGLNEILLIRAECNARVNPTTDDAMADINTLLRKRFVSGTYNDTTIVNRDSALSFILQERRKELPFTSNIRWQDLRRLNQDSRFAILLHHQYSGVSYTLPPGDPKYVFPIPDDEIRLSKISQNPR